MASLIPYNVADDAGAVDSRFRGNDGANREWRNGNNADGGGNNGNGMNDASAAAASSGAGRGTGFGG